MRAVLADVVVGKHKALRRPALAIGNGGEVAGPGIVEPDTDAVAVAVLGIDADR
jgi:hypothetical protein